MSSCVVAAVMGVIAPSRFDLMVEAAEYGFGKHRNEGGRP